MANPIIYRMEPQLRNDLIAYRHNEKELRKAIILSSVILDEIRNRELWLDNHPLGHPGLDQVLADLAILRNNLNENAIEQTTIRQQVHLQHYNLAHWVNHTSNFRSSFPYCFACETVQEIEAVHSLKNCTVYWTEHYVFRVALLPPPPHAPFQQLLNRARKLRLDLFILPL